MAIRVKTKDIADRLKPSLRRKSSSTYSDQNRVRLVKGGNEYFILLLELIEQAKHYIHLQTYIFDDDETGQLVAAALKAAAARKVRVYLLVDAYASQGLPKVFVNELKDAGVHFRFFAPLLKNKYFYFGRRMHHKIFVVDAVHALVGGINISNHYSDLDGIPAWLDMAVHVEGEISTDLCVLCWKTWKSFPINMKLTPCERMTLSYEIKPEDSCQVRMRRNDWVRRKNEISSTYVQMIRGAQSHITILCSYFLPGEIIRRTMKEASKRGVKITVITAGPADVMLSKRAERWLYDWMLRNNIDLYEYQPSVLHAKVAVCDGKWFTIGSYNVNDISAYASIELNLDIQNEVLAENLEVIIQNIIDNDCSMIVQENYKKTKNLFIQFSQWASYMLIRLIFNVLTSYYTRKR